MKTILVEKMFNTFSFLFFSDSFMRIHMNVKSTNKALQFSSIVIEESRPKIQTKYYKIIRTYTC